MDDKFVICPFNNSHIISRLRIQYHLVKCKKNYPNSKKIVCPYDATEYIDPNNFMQHLSQCKKNTVLLVGEEYKIKQFESIQHGCVNNHPFRMPSHVRVTDEWDIAASEATTSGDAEISHDERNALKIRQQSSNAVRKACNYIRLIPHPMGRGEANEAMRQYLNNYKPPLKHDDPSTPVMLGNDDNDEIFEDACDDAEKMDALSDCNLSYKTQGSVLLADNDSDTGTYELDCKKHSGSLSSNGSKPTSITNSDKSNVESLISNNSKYYKPPFGRGSRVLEVAGRGIPVGRGTMCEIVNSVTSFGKSFDDVLKLVVDQKLLSYNKTKENVISFSGSLNKTPPVVDEMMLEKEKKIALTPSDILVSETSSISDHYSSISDKQNGSQSSLSAKHQLNECLSTPNDKSPGCYSEIDENCKDKSISRDTCDRKTHLREENVEAVSSNILLEDTVEYLPRPNCSIGRGFRLKSYDY